ncbi:MAG: DUF4832 domain-containing protein [Tannerella sp.]|jgi:hypothetical protein|nr:DUF4832 domain-containing protein [Tannerella sp.]
MKNIYVLFFLLIVFVSCSQNNVRNIEFRGICADDYQGRNGLYNPDRGFRLETAVDVVEDMENPTGALTVQAEKYKDDSVSLIQSYFYLTYTVGKDLIEDNFTVMQAYFDQLERMGMKAVLRFAYEKDFMGRAAIGPTLEQALLHLEQLKPFLEKNKHLILVVQAGVIGAWGEWHSSVHNLHKSDDSKRAILKKIMEVVPDDKMVQVRVPTYKNLLKEEPELYKRISFHDDFIVIKPEPWDADMHEGTDVFNQIVEESPYLVVDGELPWGFWSVGKDPDAPTAGWLIDGHEVARRLFLQHYTSLSVVHNYKEQHSNQIFDEGSAPEYSMIVWKKTPLSEEFLKQNNMPVSTNYFENRNGSKIERNVFDYIRDHLGYRIELQRISCPEEFKVGEKISLEIELINRGFATVFGNHKLYVVLVDENEKVIEFPLEANLEDWQPHQPGDETYTPLLHKVEAKIDLPESLPSGTYKLGLWIPDGSDQLKYNNRYAIRCANGDIKWEIFENSKYGVNVLTEILVSK